MKLVSAASALAVIMSSACSSPPPVSAGGFDSPDPSAKIYAIREAARTGDRRPETLRHLVEQLDSDDPAVRFVAIAALERLTGENRGYDYAAPPIERREAAQRWADALDAAEATADDPVTASTGALPLVHDGADPDG